MSHGDSPDGFVFPPFIPPSAARPPAPPPADAPAPAARPQMPWDAETPIVAEPAAPAAGPVSAAPAEEPAGEDLPWLELPERAERAAEPAAAEDPDEEFPDWLSWDARAEADAEAELMGTPPLEGLEEFAPADDFALADDLAPPAAAAEEDAVPFAEEDAFLYGELPATEPAEESPRIADVADLELEPGYGFAPEEDGDAGYPAPAEAPHGFAPEASEDPFSFPEPESAAPAPAPFVADDEAVMASEPDPFTLAEIDATEAVEPAAEEAETGTPEAAAAGATAFDEVAARLEEIARMLRERPDELLAGRAGDPLALLVTGYVMGYGHGRRG